MKPWMKYLISAASGFAVTYATAKGSGATNTGAAVAGGLGLVTTLGNLQASSPADHGALGLK